MIEKKKTVHVPVIKLNNPIYDFEKICDCCKKTEDVKVLVFKMATNGFDFSTRRSVKICNPCRLILAYELNT